MRALLLTLVALVAGCAAEPYDAHENDAPLLAFELGLPLTFDVGAQLSDAQLEAVAEAVDQLNNAAGFVVLRRVDRNARAHVTTELPNAPPGTALAQAQVSPSGRCDLRMAAVTHTSVFVHEFMHCLGFVHSDDPSSLMFAFYADGQRLTDEDVAALRALR